MVRVFVANEAKPRLKVLDCWNQAEEFFHRRGEGEGSDCVDEILE